MNDSPQSEVLPYRLSIGSADLFSVSGPSRPHIDRSALPSDRQTESIPSLTSNHNSTSIPCSMPLLGVRRSRNRALRSLRRVDKPILHDHVIGTTDPAILPRMSLRDSSTNTSSPIASGSPTRRMTNSPATKLASRSSCPESSSVATAGPSTHSGNRPCYIPISSPFWQTIPSSAPISSQLSSPSFTSITSITSITSSDLAPRCINNSIAGCVSQVQPNYQNPSLRNDALFKKPLGVPSSPLVSSQNLQPHSAPRDQYSLKSPSSKAFTASLLGHAVSWGSLLSKIPQILKLFTAKSTDGLSFPMFATELLTQSIATLYHINRGYPLASYGENVSLGLGNLAIIFAFVVYGQRPLSAPASSTSTTLNVVPSTPDPHRFNQFTPIHIHTQLVKDLLTAFIGYLPIPPLRRLLLASTLRLLSTLPHSLSRSLLVAYVSLSSSFQSVLHKAAWVSPALSHITSIQLLASSVLVLPLLMTPLLYTPRALAVLQALRLPLYCLSRVPQITSLLADKRVGNLSPVSFLVNLLGSVIRIITSKHQTQGDLLVIGGFWASIILNIVIIIFYGYYSTYPGGLLNHT